jgi:proline iminopeptidase
MMMLGLTLLIAGCAPGPPEEEPEKAGLENGSFTAELDGFKIHYEVHGQGPVLMTVPNSWGLTHEGLRALYRPLEQHLTMVYFDPRGMGLSDPIREDADMGVAAVRADFDALRRHLGLEKVAAIGWSNGAANLTLLASEYPETLDAAIFLHGVARFSDEDMQTFAEKYPQWMEAYVAIDKELSAGEVTPVERDGRLKEFNLEIAFPMMLADPQAHHEQLRELYAVAGFSWSHSKYVERDMPSFDAREQLGAITARSLVMAGAHDTFPPERGKEIADGIENATFLVFENSAHFAPIEEPEAFQKAVLDFLRE